MGTKIKVTQENFNKSNGLTRVATAQRHPLAGTAETGQPMFHSVSAVSYFLGEPAWIQGFPFWVSGRSSIRLLQIKGFAKTVSPSNIRSYTHRRSPTWLPKHELNKDGIDTHVKVGGGVYDASTLHKESQATEECPEWEKTLSPGKNISIDHSRWSALETYLQVTRTEWVGYI